MAGKDGLVNKARYWTIIIYPENLNCDVLKDAEDEIGIPFAYCIHDKDLDGHQGDRKKHIHVLAAFGNTTTRKHVFEMFASLSKPGKVCCLPPQACGDVRKSYDYLIHDTDNCRKKGKHQYSATERVLCNNFDIGLYEQLSEVDKLRMAQELMDFCETFGFQDMAQLYKGFRRAEQFRDEYDNYFQVFKSVNAMLFRLCLGNDKQARMRRQEAKPPKCSWCGSNRVAGKIDTVDGYLWYCQECQETAYIVLTEFEGDTVRRDEDD